MSAMFLQDQGAKITTETVLEALANPHDRRILAAAQENPVDAQEIIQTTGIPKSTVYRRIERLAEKGLLETADGRLRNGHAIDRYLSRVTHVTITVEDGKIQAQWRSRETPVDQLGLLDASDSDRGEMPPFGAASLAARS